MTARAATLFRDHLGSRLTGAGFGSCTVSLVAETALSDFEQKLEPLVDNWSDQSIVIGTPEQARVTEVIA
jgi:galactokinase